MRLSGGNEARSMGYIVYRSAGGGVEKVESTGFTLEGVTMLRERL